MNLIPKSFALCLIATPVLSDAHDDKLAVLSEFFRAAQIVSGPDVVDCKLSEGAETECFSITVKAEPSDYTPGPWCPSSISDGPEAGGIWLKDGDVHDVDGAFIANLAKFYGDDNWQLFDEATGQIRVTDTKESCDAAARPDVDPEFQNHCVQCLPEYMPEDATMTYVIPLDPQAKEDGQSSGPDRGGSGVAANGVRLDGPAPVDAILGAYTIAAFDDCGGHVNLHVGYHYHAVTGCIIGTPEEDHATKIGIAMDGYGIFERVLLDGTEVTDLDACNGHDTDGVGYHYHAGDAGSNQILACLKAQSGCASEDPDQSCDATARRPRP